MIGGIMALSAAVRIEAERRARRYWDEVERQRRHASDQRVRAAWKQEHDAAVERRARCRKCHGRGKIEVPYVHGHHPLDTEMVACPRCNGSGKRT